MKNKLKYFILFSAIVFAVLHSCLSEEESSEEVSNKSVPREFDLFSAYNCNTRLTEETLDIVTWNIEFFPKADDVSETITRVSSLIKKN